jgi:hypothetical protein
MNQFALQMIMFPQYNDRDPKFQNHFQITSEKHNVKAYKDESSC